MRSTSRSHREGPRKRQMMSLFATLILLSPSACTLFAGEPWGEATLTADVRFTPSAARLTDDGALKTSKDYALVLETMALGMREIDLVMSEGGGGAVSFDPASPPPGYSLCHSGHCHHDDGRLVDYEDIEIELAGGGGAGGFVTLRPVRESALDLLVDGPIEPALDACLDDCILPRGTFVSSGAVLEDLRVLATVFDLRPVANARLPMSGTRISVLVSLDARVDTRIEGAIDDASPPSIEIDLHLALPETLFDGVDFGAVLGVEPVDARVSLDGFLSVTESLRNELLRASRVTADVVRPETSPFAQPDLVLWNP